MKWDCGDTEPWVDDTVQFRTVWRVALPFWRLYSKAHPAAVFALDYDVEGPDECFGTYTFSNGLVKHARACTALARRSQGARKAAGAFPGMAGVAVVREAFAAATGLAVSSVEDDQ